jgi:CheY-like chemotaxis protein
MEKSMLKKRKKVLLVDDSATALMIEQMLLSRKYDIVVARDGREAVEKAVAERPDLILMDVMMPNMNGLEATRAIRGLPEIKDIPIIIVTTRGENENVEAGFASGCNDYVTKPINGLELLTKFRDQFGE